jgi:phosphoribosylaminoimidazole-succinocarboxamide synthase
MNDSLSDTNIPELKLFKKGKVREVYEVEDHLLMVASDRISAFDYVLPSLIPDKGKVLTQVSKFWFDFTSLICPNHVVSTEVDEYPAVLHKYRTFLEKRSMLTKKTKVFPVECVVRGYLAGSGWKDYQASGRTSGVKLPPGLQQGDRLEEVIFTPATKAEEGHDINISFKEMQKMVGADLAQKIKRISIELYQKASLHALSKSIIIKSQPSLDKQFVRDYLESTDWDKQSDPPELPDSIIRQTAERYREIFRLLTGNDEL